MNTLELVILRHGQTRANFLNIIQGQTDVPLDEVGLRQAARAAEVLKGERFDAVYSSDLSRAFVTARTICPEGEILKDPALREWDLGVWQGKSMDEIKREYPEIYAEFRNEDLHTRIPGGESRYELRQRIKGFLRTLPVKHPDGGKILMVSHGGTIKALFQVLMGEENVFPKAPQVGNCSIGRFVRMNGIWQLISWNEESHLKDFTSLGARY